MRAFLIAARKELQPEREPATRDDQNKYNIFRYCEHNSYLSVYAYYYHRLHYHALSMCLGIYTSPIAI